MLFGDVWEQKDTLAPVFLLVGVIAQLSPHPLDRRLHRRRKK